MQRNNIPVSDFMALDAAIKDFFMFCYNDLMFNNTNTRVCVDKEMHNLLYNAALVKDNTVPARCVTAPHQPGDTSVIDSLSSKYPPLTAAGRLAAEGKFEEAEWLCDHGANKNAMLVGAAAGGQLDYLLRPENGCWRGNGFNESLQQTMSFVASYNKQRDVVNALLRYTRYLPWPLTGAVVGGHLDYFEELAANEHRHKDSLVNMMPVAFDCLRAQLYNPYNGLRFLAECKDQLFRAEMLENLRRTYLGKIEELQLPYSAYHLVDRARRIRKNMDEQSLSFEDAYQNEYTAALERAKQFGETVQAELHAYDKAQPALPGKVNFVSQKAKNLFYDEVCHYPDAPEVVTAFIAPLGIKPSFQGGFITAEHLQQWFRAENAFAISLTLLNEDKYLRSKINALPQYNREAVSPVLREYEVVFKEHNDMLDEIEKDGFIKIINHLFNYSSLHRPDLNNIQTKLEEQQWLLEKRIVAEEEALKTISGFFGRVTRGVVGFFSVPSRPVPAMAASAAACEPEQDDNSSACRKGVN